MLVVLGTAARADTLLPPDPLAVTQLPDPAQEAAARGLMMSLRCVVCQGQSIADSDADMAGSMRALVRRRILAGERPERIRAWLIERYGEYITYDPPLSASTWPLWIAPIVLLLGGVWLARGSFRHTKPKRP